MNILPHILAIIGLLLAIVIGTLIAEGRNTLLAIGIGLPLLYFFIKTAGAYWILIGLLYSTIGIEIQPVGPRLEPVHVVLAMVFIYLLANFWRSTPTTYSNNGIYFKPFMYCFLMLLVYTIGTSFFNTLYPHAYLGDAIRNLMKQQTSICGGFSIIAIAWTFRQRFSLGNSPIPIILIIFGIGLIFNLSLRLYGIFALKIGEIDVMTGMEVPHSTLFVPLINATDNIFILRFLGPLACCVSVSILTSQCNQNKTRFVRFLSLLILILGFAGSVASQGRAAVFLSFAMIAFVLLARRKIGFLLIVFACFFSFLLAAKVAYEYDHRIVPAAVQRSLGWLPFMRSSHMRSSIDSSTRWRSQVFTSSVEEIASSLRILLVGRGVYAFTERDSEIIRMDGWNGAVEVARRRAASHNLFTDVILTNGVIGLAVYLLTYVALLWGLYKTWGRKNINDSQGDLALACLSSLTIFLGFSFVGGGFPQTIEALIVAMVVLMGRKDQPPIKA